MSVAMQYPLEQLTVANRQNKSTSISPFPKRERRSGIYEGRRIALFRVDRSSIAPHSPRIFLHTARTESVAQTHFSSIGIAAGCASREPRHPHSVSYPSYTLASSNRQHLTPKQTIQRWADNQPSSKPALPLTIKRITPPSSHQALIIAPEPSSTFPSVTTEQPLEIDSIHESTRVSDSNTPLGIALIILGVLSSIGVICIVLYTKK